MGTSHASVMSRNKLHSGQGNPRLICYWCVLFMLVINQYAATQKIVHPVMNPVINYQLTLQAKTPPDKKPVF